METAKAHLVRVGSVHRRPLTSSRDAWVIRYRETVDGRRVNRSIYLGLDESLARHAWALIRRWRQEARTPEDIRREELLNTYKRTLACLRISGRGRARLLREARRSFGNPRRELEFAMKLRAGNPNLDRTGRPGRPAKAGLW